MNIIERLEIAKLKPILLKEVLLDESPLASSCYTSAFEKNIFDSFPISYLRFCPGSMSFRYIDTRYLKLGRLSLQAALLGPKQWAEWVKKLNKRAHRAGIGNWYDDLREEKEKQKVKGWFNNRIGTMVERGERYRRPLAYETWRRIKGCINFVIESLCYGNDKKLTKVQSAFMQIVREFKPTDKGFSSIYLRKMEIWRADLAKRLGNDSFPLGDCKEEHFCFAFQLEQALLIALLFMDQPFYLGLCGRLFCSPYPASGKWFSETKVDVTNVPLLMNGIEYLLFDGFEETDTVFYPICRAGQMQSLIAFHLFKGKKELPNSFSNIDDRHIEIILSQIRRQEEQRLEEVIDLEVIHGLYEEKSPRVIKHRWTAWPENYEPPKWNVPRTWMFASLETERVWAMILLRVLSKYVCSLGGILYHIEVSEKRESAEVLIRPSNVLFVNTNFPSDQKSLIPPFFSWPEICEGGVFREPEEKKSLQRKRKQNFTFVSNLRKRGEKAEEKDDSVWNSWDNSRDEILVKMFRKRHAIEIVNASVMTSPGIKKKEVSLVPRWYVEKGVVTEIYPEVRTVVYLRLTPTYIGEFFLIPTSSVVMPAKNALSNIIKRLRSLRLTMCDMMTKTQFEVYCARFRHDYAHLTASLEALVESNDLSPDTQCEIKRVKEFSDSILPKAFTSYNDSGEACSAFKTNRFSAHMHCVDLPRMFFYNVLDRDRVFRDDNMPKRLQEQKKKQIDLSCPDGEEFFCCRASNIESMLSLIGDNIAKHADCAGEIEIDFLRHSEPFSYIELVIINKIDQSFEKSSGSKHEGINTLKELALDLGAFFQSGKCNSDETKWETRLMLRAYIEKEAPYVP